MMARQMDLRSIVNHRGRNALAKDARPFALTQDGGAVKLYDRVREYLEVNEPDREKIPDLWGLPPRTAGSLGQANDKVSAAAARDLPTDMSEFDLLKNGATAYAQQQRPPVFQNTTTGAQPSITRQFPLSPRTRDVQRMLSEVVRQSLTRAMNMWRPAFAQRLVEMQTDEKGYFELRLAEVTDRITHNLWVLRRSVNEIFSRQVRETESGLSKPMAEGAPISCQERLTRSPGMNELTTSAADRDQQTSQTWPPIMRYFSEPGATGIMDASQMQNYLADLERLSRESDNRYFTFRQRDDQPTPPSSSPSYSVITREMIEDAVQGVLPDAMEAWIHTLMCDAETIQAWKSEQIQHRLAVLNRQMSTSLRALQKDLEDQISQQLRENARRSIRLSSENAQALMQELESFSLMRDDLRSARLDQELMTRRRDSFRRGKDEYLELRDDIMKQPKRHPDYKILGNVICKLVPNAMGTRLQWKIYVANDLRQELIRVMHEHPISGHRNISDTIQQVRDKHHWPDMNDDIRYYINTCPKCQASRKPPRAKIINNPYHENGSSPPS